LNGYLNFYKARERRVGNIQPVSFQGVLVVSFSEELKDLKKMWHGVWKSFWLRNVVTGKVLK